MLWSISNKNKECLSTHQVLPTYYIDIEGKLPRKTLYLVLINPKFRNMCVFLSDSRLNSKATSISIIFICFIRRCFLTIIHYYTNKTWLKWLNVYLKIWFTCIKIPVHRFVGSRRQISNINLTKSVYKIHKQSKSDIFCFVKNEEYWNSLIFICFGLEL